MDPYALYLACLAAIKERFKHLHNTENQMVQELLHVIRSEMAYAGEQGVRVHELEELV